MSEYTPRDLFTICVNTLAEKNIKYIRDHDANFNVTYETLKANNDSFDVNTVIRKLIAGLPGLEVGKSPAELEQIRQDKIRSATNEYNKILKDANPSDLVPIVAQEARDHQREAKNKLAQDCIDRRVAQEQNAGYPALPEYVGKKKLTKGYLLTLLQEDRKTFAYLRDKYGAGQISQLLNS